MNKRTFKFLLIVGCMVTLGTLASATANWVTVFSAQTIDTFEEESFEGNTRYQAVQLDNQTVLKATTEASASALFKKITIDVTQTPFLNWRWRVENIYDIDDQTTKKGDDYPARIYVVFREGLFPWQTRALNYVWSSRETGLDFWPNPFTDKAIMIPVRSGADHLGRWQSERVNVAEDYFRIFGKRIDTVDGIAIMSDSDNSGDSAVAYYGDISFSN